VGAGEALDGEAVKKLWMDRCRFEGEAAGDAGRLEGDVTTESSSQPQSAHRVRAVSTGSAHTAHVRRLPLPLLEPPLVVIVAAAI